MYTRVGLLAILLEPQPFHVRLTTSSMEPIAVYVLMPTSLLLLVLQRQFTLPVLPRRSLIQVFALTAAQSMATGHLVPTALKQLLVFLLLTISAAHNALLVRL